MNKILNILLMAVLASALMVIITIVYFGFNCTDYGMAVPSENSILEDVIEELELMSEEEKTTFELYCESIYNDKEIPFDEAQRETRANGYECPQNY